MMINNGWLVVEPYPSEKYESQLGRIIPYMMKNKSHVPNHQPEKIKKSKVSLENRNHLNSSRFLVLMLQG